MSQVDRSTRLRRIAVHSARVALFIILIACVHSQHRQREQVRALTGARTLTHSDAQRFFPRAARVGEPSGPRGWQAVYGPEGDRLGWVIQTSPASDSIVGFSGSTNVMVAFGPDERIRGLAILESGDTAEHRKQVEQDKRFLASWNGLTWDEAAELHHVDAVSGATLTSIAVEEAVIRRLTGSTVSLRFPDPLNVLQARPFFPDATTVRQDNASAFWWHVLDATGNELGTLLRSSPSAEMIVGYQGPTEVVLALDHDERVIGMALGKSFDNEPYVSYVRDDRYFRELFEKMAMSDLATLDLKQAGIEGVSGATMTSMAVAESLVRSAADFQRFQQRRRSERRWRWTWADVGTLVVIGLAVVVTFTRLRSSAVVRRSLQWVVVCYLGLTNGDLLSQAMLMGWAESGIPLRTAVGLTALAAAAFVLPLSTGRNVYCQSLCPHGVVQQWIKRRLPWQFRVPRRMAVWLRLLPPVLLAWCLIVVMADLPFSLTVVEPFHGWVWRVSVGASLGVAIVSLIASLFIPMAYCRYGCPTGAMIAYLRRHKHNDRWTARDWIASALTGLAVLLFFAL